ncbi:MAG TPA: condensation domain-containing protein, partial [Pseudonocardiaceae bacterium]
MLAALALALARWHGSRGTDERSALLRLEGHGREDAVVPGADLSRTMGWFTSMYPVRLDLGDVDLDEVFAGGPAAGVVIKAVKEQLLAIPDKGLGYGLLRYLNDETAAVLRQFPTGQISFNYLGRFSAADMPEHLIGLGWTQAPGTSELNAALDADMPALSTLEINAVVTDTEDGPALTATFGAPAGALSPTDVRELAGLWQSALEGISRHAGQPGAGGLTPSDVPLVSVRQREIEAWERQYPGLVDIWPLTPLQSGLLFHSMLDESGYDTYHVQVRYHLSGPVDPKRMRAAGQALLDRYANLRTAFVPDAAGDLVQLVVDGIELPWREIDLRDLDQCRRGAALERFLAEDRAARLDLATPPLLRLLLVLTGPEEAELVVSSHHALLDGWSLGVLMRDLLRLYGSGGEGALPRLRGYRDFLAWLAQQDRDVSARAWQDELDGIDEPTLIAPHAPSDVPPGKAGELDVPLAPEVARELAKRAADLGVTLNTLVQGAWAVVLGFLTGRSDVVFGATVSGRPPTVAGVESMVGLFINTLPVRVRLSPWHSLRRVVTDLQERQAALLDHHHYGLPDIQRAVGMNVLFDTTTVFESIPMAGDDAGGTDATGGIALTGASSDGGTHYPLGIAALADPDLRLVMQYQGHLFERSAAEGIAVQVAHVLGQLAADPDLLVGRVDLLDAVHRDRMFVDLNQTTVTAGEHTISELFGRQVAANPDAVAVVFEQTSLTYRGLSHQVDRLAGALIERGVGPESVVAVALRRSPELVVALLAVARAGGVYLPIDHTYPAERAGLMITDSGAGLAVVDATTADALAEHGLPQLRVDLLPDDADDTAIRSDVALDATAYIIYTSGSTGRPKGVAVPHRGVAALAAAHAERLRVTADSRMLQLASASF